MTEPFSFKATIAFFLSVWARSAVLFWCLAVACLVFLIALVAGAHWQLGDTPALLAAYGTILGLALPVLLVFAAFKTYSERPPPVLSLLPQDNQSFCGQCQQKDGRITTQLVLRFRATNLTDGAIMLSGIKLCRPFVRRAAILQKILMVRHPNGGIYSPQYPIEPHGLTYGLADIMIARPVGRTGKTIRAVVAVQDHSGNWHKIIFPHLPVRGDSL